MRRPAESTQQCIAVGLLLGMALAAPVRAVDGVIEINQAKAKVGGVTPGDTPLFPVTISQPGSYRLTSNLDVTDATARPAGTAPENTTAIEVTVDNVTVDLNGFMITGPTVCSPCNTGPMPFPVPCSPLGNGSGILGLRKVAVRNGTVNGMGGFGIALAVKGSLVENVRALNNGANGAGISADLVSNSSAIQNASVGISAFTIRDSSASCNGSSGLGGITVINSTAALNRLSGIEASEVSNSAGDSNGGFGINAESVTNSRAEANFGDGIKALNVHNCTAGLNGQNGIAAVSVSNSTAWSNGLVGISAITVSGSSARSNVGDGIQATVATGCEASSNTGTHQISTTGITGQNICAGSPCP